MKNLTIKNRQPGLHRGEIIAAWTYTHDDWKRYLRWQQQRRQKYVWMQIMNLVTTGGILGLLQISKVCGYPALKKKTVIITATGVVMRKRFIPFNTHTHELKTIQIIEGLQAYVFILAIRSHSAASKQKVTTLLIPVPKGRLGEAVRLLMRFEKHEPLAVRY